MAISSKELDARFRDAKRKTEEADAKRRAEKLGFQYLDLVSVKVPTELKAMEIVPEEQARAAFLSPLQLFYKQLVVAVFDPTKPEAAQILQDLKKAYDVRVVVVSLTGLQHAWSHYMYIQASNKEISGKVDIDEKRMEEVRRRITNFDSFAEIMRGLSSKTTE